MSVSGLSDKHCVIARHRTIQAAVLALNHRGSVHYTQDSRRWSGIAGHDVAAKGDYPHYADCSAFVTWCLWNGLHVPFNVRDVVNHLHWRAGYTGTMLSGGRRVRGALRVGDAVIYGHGFPGEHTALYVGGGMVISHGSEAGPLKVPMRYRGDVMQVRRYI